MLKPVFIKIDKLCFYWNDTHAAIRELLTLNSFIKQLKTYLMG